jgi:hypothetical protein
LSEEIAEQKAHLDAGGIEQQPGAGGGSPGLQRPPLSPALVGAVYELHAVGPMARKAPGFNGLKAPGFNR